MTGDRVTGDRVTGQVGVWSRTRPVATWLALALVVASAAYLGWFRLHGGRWERVETSSMGTTAPVGTLLWVEPVEPAALRVGDIASFHRPGSGPDGPVYSHRIAVLHADGTFGTAGDLSGPDQWRVAPTDVVGRVAHRWPGAGWLVLAAPVLALGALATAAVTRLVRRDVRRDVRLALALVGGSLTLAVAVVLYHPLTGVQQLGFETVASGARATYVSTGLLPIRVSAPDADGIVLRAGQAGSIVVPRPAEGSSRVGLGPALPWWFWPGLVGSTFVPAVADTVAHRRRRRLHPGDSTA